MKVRFFTVPNLLTLANLACGCLAVVYALRFDDLQIAFWLIVGAAAFDFFDGFAARLLKQYSALGRELDSLADMVSFGVAPSAVLFSMYQFAGGIGAWGFFVFFVALFSALRLAKFNIDETQAEEFDGLPTPANAIFIMSAGHFYAAGLYTLQPWMILAAAAVCACLLIAPVRMFALKFKGFGWPGNEIRYGFLLASLAGLIAVGARALPFIVPAYVLISVVRNISGKNRS